MASKFSPAASLDQIKGIGPSFQKLLDHLDLTTVRDLLHHYPSRYLDYTVSTPIRQLSANKEVSFTATISKPKRFSSKSGKLVIQAEATDDTGRIALTWFNNPYIERLIRPDFQYLIAGKTSFFSNKLTLISPTIEPVGTTSLHTSGLVPIYPLTAKLTSRFLRTKINFILQNHHLPDPLPEKIRHDLALPDYHESLTKIHLPGKKEDQEGADLRLAFNHHLAQNITNQINLAKLPPANPIVIDQTLHRHLIETLPFQLTNGQKRAISASYTDLASANPTHRLIQGETGSGKTVVVFFLAAQCLADKQSFCLLAPTEILARQHFQSFLKLGLPKSQLLLVTASSPLKEIPTRPSVYIGTHALINQLPLELPVNLNTVVVDEQHKFGVSQREAISRRNPSVHLFNLSATPIPRTLALGLFGEVEITTLKGKPKNRLPVKTWVISQERYKQSHAWFCSQLVAGSKIFVVTPLIHQSAKLQDVASIEKVYHQYQKDYGGLTKIFMLHGQMENQAIQTTLAQFKNTNGGILVATTIIEVGIDIQQADIIVIHSAHRFGLATLHQLRGRVGRGERESYCFLISSDSDETSTQRLKLMEKYHSGLILAKKDLRLRGSGELFGTRQHGWLPVRLKNFWNRRLYQTAKTVARDLITQDQIQAATIANNLLTW